MVILWTFDTSEKLNQFCSLLVECDISHETGAKNKSINELTISVNESDYKAAKKMLIKFKKRKTIREHIPTHR